PGNHRVPRHTAHGRRDGAEREAKKPQVTGLINRRPPTEGGEDCAQDMARREKTKLEISEWELDERDHSILLALLEHKVLTTDQIKSLFFRSLRRCQHRLKELKE